MNTNLHHLQLFYYVAKAGGISHAVKIIPYGIQQPAISQQMQQLETELGVKLFERRPFSLTPSGEKLFKFLAGFFTNLETELEIVKNSAGFRLRFACPSVVSSKYLPILMKRCIEVFPDFRPHISELDGFQSLKALLGHEADIGIFFAPDNFKSKLVTIKKLRSMPYCLIVPNDHRFIKEGFWPKSDFAKEKWIAVQEQSGGSQDLMEVLSGMGITPQFSASASSIEAVLSYVEMHIGIALMAMPPPDLVKPYKVKVLPQPEIFGNLDLVIGWLNDLEVEKKFLNFLVSEAKNLALKV